MASSATTRPAAQPASACRAETFEGTPFTLCTADRARHDIILVDRGTSGAPLRDFTALPDRLGKDLPRVAFAMNAGMFGVTGLPIGLYVENGRRAVRLNRRTGFGNFYTPPPNGVFFGDGKGWHIVTTARFAARGPASPDFATQSGPMLVIDGAINPGFDANGASLNIRNGVGIAANGEALFAISDAPVSFGRFARLFRKLGCADALYFDGSISRLWDPVAGRMDRGAKIGPIVVVLQKR
ncbi:phosphodiester glycosidase family protein [Sphingomonas oligophenolica]